jgi:ribosomal protein L13
MPQQRSLVLQGRINPRLSQLPMTDIVVCSTPNHAVLTGKKFEEKIYYRHSGSQAACERLLLLLSTPSMVKSGAEILWKAVNGMLPKNNCAKVRTWAQCPSVGK